MDFRTKLPSYDDDPPLPLFSPSSTNREHTMSNISAYAKGLRKQIQEDSTQDTTTSEYSKPTHLEDSGSMSFIGTKRKNPDSIRSPPRIMPYITEPSSLANTPRNEAARILTENSLQAVDMGESISPDDESMQSFYEHTPSHVASDKQPWQDAPVREDWDNTNLMETESEEQRRNFDIFIQKRQTAKSKVADQELQRRWTGALRSPSNRASKPIQQQQHEEEQSKLVGTPTIERVLNRKQLNLKKDNYFLQDEDEDMGAYEFSDKLPTQ
ncbi:uncharacterized protein B0P05DRAFT_560458 [Gilbertella persicaria]|nr:uncharacterized protein B0P05DRAFT_560458 [Gilbertella persicaria]KAI8056329.1 hypothetical protein B0P05DRAFT_560458 [Gilbertella persicaria]